MSSYLGMNAQNGRAIASGDHLAQSISDILTTPVGSRLARREYGSLLPELIDAPANQNTLLQLYAAAATALIRWEPRLRLTRVSTDAATSGGRVALSIEGNRARGGAPFSTAVMIAGARAS